MSVNELTNFLLPAKILFKIAHPKANLSKGGLQPNPNFSAGLASRFKFPPWINPIITSSDLGEYLLAEVRETEEPGFSGGMKVCIIENFTPLLLLLMNRLHTPLDILEVRRIVPYIPENPLEDYGYVYKFLELLRQTILTEFNRNAAGTITDMALSARMLIQLAARSQESLGTLLLYQLGPPPSYLPRTTQMRIVLCMLHPHFGEMQRELREAFPSVRGGRVDEGWLKRPLRRVRPEDWESLLQYLPSVREADHLTKGHHEALHVKLENALWGVNQPRNEQRRKIRMNLEPADLPLPNMSIGKPDRKDLLEQAFTLFLTNWEEIWRRRGWPRNFEMQRRLRFLKEVTGWRPNVRSVIRIMFSS